MLELRPTCEHCGRALPADSTEARVCTFECTFCSDCVENVLANVCPNCGGGFERRPIRPKAALVKHPARVSEVRKRVDEAAFALLRAKLRGVPPELR